MNQLNDFLKVASKDFILKGISFEWVMFIHKIFENSIPTSHY